jgi:hypothetical protein
MKQGAMEFQKKAENQQHHKKKGNGASMCTQLEGSAGGYFKS